MSAIPNPNRGTYTPEPRVTPMEAWRASVRELNEAREQGAPEQEIKARERVAEMAEEAYAQSVAGGNVGDNDKMTEARATFAAAVGKMSAELRQLVADGESGKYPPTYVRNERARLVAELRAADADAQQAVSDYQLDVSSEVARLRAAAEANVDPATRMADELERKRLSETRDPESLVNEAQQLLDAGQAKRAKLLLGAAQDTGKRMPVGTQQLAIGIEKALDAEVPERKRAAELVVSATKKLSEWRSERARMLSTSGFGETARGEVGQGTSSDAARASVSDKVTDFVESGRAAEYARRGSSS